jgi:hypothetical protein
MYTVLCSTVLLDKVYFINIKVEKEYTSTTETKKKEKLAVDTP